MRWRRPPFEHVLDVIQDGRHARAVGSSGRRDCPTVRKSVRFELTSGAIALQFSGVAAPTITFVVSLAN